MATKFVDIEVWVVVDSDGDCRVGLDQDSAHESYTDDVGSTLATRQIKVMIRVPLPAPIVLSATLPEEPAGAELSVQ